MKRIISIILCLSIIFGFSANGFSAVETVSSSVNTNKTDDTITATEFALKLNSLIEYSESLSFTNEKGEFETARLVVKSSSEINTDNTVSVVNGFDDLWVLQYASPEDAETAYNSFKTKDNIEFVEVDKKVSAISSAESMHIPYEQSLDDRLSWGPSYIGIDVMNDKFIEQNLTLQNVTVAVVDTGVDHTHEFLKDRVVPTRINTCGEGERNSSMDDNGHGTQIAGVIVDSTPDNVTVRAYKALDRYGNGTLVSVAAAINCAVKDGVDVINISLGFYEESEVLKSAIHNAYVNDIFIVASAGNDKTDAPYYPSSYNEVVRVGAVNERGIVANFSNYTDIDISAPGVSVYTTTLNNGYQNVSGTSIASPFVASVAAMILSVSPEATPEDLTNIITDNAVDVMENDSSIYYGAGILYSPEAHENYTNYTKTATPVFSHATAIYRETFELTITCDTPDAVIYYTTDRTIPFKRNPNAKIYDGTPIVIDKTTNILASAYSDGAYRSSIADFSAIVAPYVTADEVTVSPDGFITSYTGTSRSISIPESINGIAIKGIGDGVFDGKDMKEVMLHSSASVIGKNAFANNPELKSVIGLGITTVGDNAFYGCRKLKNIILGELTSIGKYSFCQAGKDEFEINEISFSLNLNGITEIPEGAFMGSAVSEIESEYIGTIGANAFTECNALVNVSINYLFSMPAGAFKGCKSLAEVNIGGLSILPVGAFSTCENLEHVHMNDVTFVNSNAFENCVALNLVELNKAEIVFSNAFNGCNSLITLDLPSMNSFEPSLEALGTIPKLPKNLLAFNAPKLEKTVKYMFSSCPDIILILLPSVTELAPKTFSGCQYMIILDLSAVESVQANAFENSAALFIYATNLVSTESLPDNSGILLTNKFVESTATPENLTVYGTPGTYIERYCEYKGYEFISIPFIFSDMPEYITENSEMVTVRAVGFNLEYQWYSNTVRSTEGGTPIEGATNESYTFTDNDNAPFYYCKITQSDIDKETVVYTDIIVKDTTPADYTEYNKAVEQALAIDKTQYINFEILEQALEVDVQNRYSCEQEYVDAQTQSILDAIENLERIKITAITLVAVTYNLRLFEIAKIIPVLTPGDFTDYSGIVWHCDNEDVIRVSESGYVSCIGNGTATVTAEITNPDGSVVTGTITFTCNLNPFEKIIAFCFNWFIILYYRINEIILT